jgi:hypothetical protein
MKLIGRATRNFLLCNETSGKSEIGFRLEDRGCDIILLGQGCPITQGPVVHEHGAVLE